MARYLLVVNFEGGVVDTPMEEWKPEEITAHLDYYAALHEALVESGELVESEVLTAAGAGEDRDLRRLGARRHRRPFQEFKEWLAGYQIVDVETEERALEIAARISAVPGPDGVPTQQPIQVRQVMESAPSDVARWRRGCNRRAASAERPAACRGPAARARAAGPRHARTQVGRFRGRRGRRPGGAARGRRALVTRRHPGGAARVAPADGNAAADRPVAERPLASGARASRRAAAGSGGIGHRRGRHAHRALHVLPPRARRRRRSR